MSRFVEILNSHEREISVENFPAMLRDMVAKLEAETGHIEMNFPTSSTRPPRFPACRA
jgi:GTP cyclohydrolase I